MEYLLPVEYTQQLQKLQCNLPPSPMTQVEAVLKQELNIERLDEVFEIFEETPVGTGRATYHCGEGSFFNSAHEFGSLLFRPLLP